MNGILLDILVVLVAAKVAAEVAERAGVPAVVGEILAGLAIGPTALGLVEPGEVLHTLAEIGVILLLLQVGLEMDLAELGSVGRASLVVAIIGVALPFAAGVGVAAAFGEPATTAIFVGAALTATSVGITARVFGDLRALASAEARTVLGAAVADDVMGLVILTVVVRLVSDGSVSVLGVAGVVGLALAFLVVTAGVGTRLTPWLFGAVQRVSRSPGTLLALALAFALAVAELASAARLATVVGAFVAGLSLARTQQAERIRRDLTPVGHLFVPVFFLQIGIDADVASLLRPRVLALAAGLLAVAVAGKLAAGLGAPARRADRLVVGLGMLPRGEVGLIFAGIGLRDGVLGADLYAALLLVVLATTLAAPPLLSWRLRAVHAARRVAAPAVPVPAGGWLVMADGVVDLRSGKDARAPGAHEALHLGLRAALELRAARPGPALLDWLGSLGPAAVPGWDPAARKELFALLRAGNARSWRFLETTGLLERALPELDAAVRRRRADPSELDPVHPVRFALVDRVHEALDGPAGPPGGPLAHPEWLALGALLVDVEADVATARRVVQRLDLGAAAEQEVALLVGESGLLRAAAARRDALSEERVLQIASHLDHPERARALYSLSTALDGLEPWHRQRLEALHTLVQAALARPELSGREARNLAEERRAAARRLVSAGGAADDRLAHAPVGWLMTLEPAVLARLAALVEPLPGRGEARLDVADVAPGRYRVEVAARDRTGLLAAVARVLADEGLDVVDATAATWPDGGTTDAFVARTGSRPDPARLQRALLEALKAPLEAAGVPEAHLSFDDQASPWYTLCAVEAPDRPGLLHALTAAFAASGASVHSARVTTTGGVARDVFELTDARGGKLDAVGEEAVRVAVAGGVVGRRARRRLWDRALSSRRERPATAASPLSVIAPDGPGGGA